MKLNFKSTQNRMLAQEAARVLLARFMDGSTSPAEERRLFAFFASSDPGSLSPDLEEVRPMMQWYAAMSPAKKETPRRRFAFRFAGGVAAAVTLLIVAAVAFHHYSSSPSTQPLYASYEGSYIVRNGKRITDISSIYTTLSRAEYTADSISSATDRWLKEVEETADIDIIDEALSAIPDPVLAARIKQEILEDDVNLAY